MKFKEKKKIALALSGGGIKAAAFHIGVCLALREKGFSFAGGSPAEVERNFPEDNPLTIRSYVGSSAGSVISTFLASGFSVEAIIEAFERGVRTDLHKLKRADADYENMTKLKPITYRDIFNLNGGSFIKFVPNVLRRRSMITGGLEALVKNGFKIDGLFTTRGLERYFRRHVWPQNRFDSLGVELYIIATQLNHSRKVVFGNFGKTWKTGTIKYADFSTISQSVAASASLPPVFAPYKIRNQKGKELFFFDGEIRDTLSTHVAADHGADLVISSYSIQPYHYTKEFGSLSNYGIPMIINQALYQVIEQKIQKHKEYQSQIKSILKAVDGYFKQTDLPEEHRDKLKQIIIDRVNFQPNTDYLYIHPSPLDHEMFFVDHFSLNPKILGRIVHIGFKSALNELRKHDI